MPGLSQLKKFAEEVEALGNEVKRREEKNEYLPKVPFPENASDVDDSDEFIFGLPEKKDDANENQNIDSSSDNIENIDSPIDIDEILAQGKEDSSPAESASNFSIPGIDDDLNLSSLDALDDFNFPDLDSQSPSDVSTFEEMDFTPESSSLEEMDFTPESSSLEEMDFTPENSSLEEMDFTPESSSLGEMDFTPESSSLGEMDFTPESSSLEEMDFTPESSSLGEMDFTPESSSLGEMDFTPESSSLEEMDFTPESSSPENSSQESSDSFGDTDFNLPDFDTSSLDSLEPTSPLDFSMESLDMPQTSGEDFNLPDFDVSNLDTPAIENENPESQDFELEAFQNVSETENNQNEDQSSDFGDFSDFDLVPPEVPQEVKKRSVSFSIGKGKKEEILTTELTEDEYKVFLENLNYYPLNLRIAVKEMIVSNEFNDDVVMDIIRKIIKKIPARQLATQVEKLVDKAIPVPANYEKRTAAEYEAYRQSFEYNLKNKVLPLTFASIIVVGFCILLGFLTAKFVVRPVKANMLYKEGYTLINNGLYPQSEAKFNEAVTYNSVKGWHFKYARAYVENKQYERASSMYERLLYNFKFDLEAGLEYATMELEERTNYIKAEEIVRRFVLDNHINSPEGILLLGDIYLEWATNRDSTKFEEARIQYANLIQLYGQTPLYLSRMLRYFIRTDKLEEVLQLKEYFYPKLKKDILVPQDIVELSGYLLDKLYGELPAKEEYLRSSIYDVRDLLETAVIKAPEIPESLYNYGRYFVETGANTNARNVLEEALGVFKATEKKSQKRLLAEIDTYRILGELYAGDLDYLRAESYYVDGLSLFETERDNSGLKTDKKVGVLYSDLANIDYFISGDYEAALSNYMNAIENYNDTPSIRYRVGYIQYANENYAEALGSFIKAVNEKPSDKYLLLALGNTLTLRNSTSAAQGYYEKLLDLLDLERNQSGVLRPQTNNVDGDLVELYMKAANNLGVVLSLRAKQTGNGNLLPQAMANFEESIRAFDALTRNQDTMIRIDGSNLAFFNQKYLSYTHSDFAPTIYTELSPILEGEKIPEKAVVK